MKNLQDWTFKARLLTVVVALLIWWGSDALIHRVRVQAAEASAIMAQANTNTEVSPVEVDKTKIGETTIVDLGWRPVIKEVGQIGKVSGIKGYLFAVNDYAALRMVVTQNVSGTVGAGFYPQVAHTEEGTGMMAHVFEMSIVLENAPIQKIYFVGTGPVGGSDAYAMYKKGLEATKKK